MAVGRTAVAGGFYYIENPLIKGVSRLNRLWSIWILFVFLFVLLCFVCSVLCKLKQRHPQTPILKTDLAAGDQHNNILFLSLTLF